MKAQEYANWFGENIKRCGEDRKLIEKCMQQFYFMFLQEYRDMIKIRHVSTGKGQAAILKELDDKCRAVSELLIKQKKISAGASFFKSVFLHNNPLFAKHFQ